VFVPPCARLIAPAILVGSILLAGCSDQGPQQIVPGVDCSTSTPVQLNPGESVILDATVNAGCIRIPAAAGTSARHLVVAYSGSGSETQSGVFGPFALSSQSVAAASAPLPTTRLEGGRQPNRAAQFHANLRSREQALAADPSRSRRSSVAVRRSPPALNSQATFKVCGDVDCSDDTFVNVVATAKYVGPRAAIYLDNTVPAGGLTQEDIDSIGSLFDGTSPNIYEIDTTAFGAESDLDGNGVVAIVLTDAVNDLSGTCADGSIILGYFFGLDLLSDPNSNNGEVFYGLVPDPDATSCRVDRDIVFDFLPPVMIHELQHMISYNQHVLIRGGAPEQTWLNEGLSHFAEELGGRQLPDSRCPGFSSCMEQFAVWGNIPNAFAYLTSPQLFFLVYPQPSFGSLQERGASWLFVRWLVDHEAADTVLGADLTRALVRTTSVGAANVAAVAGQSFENLVGQWQMANFAERLGGFSDQTGRLRYKTWDLVSTFLNEGAPYPLAVDSITTGVFASTGFLRGGSGKHVLVVQPANGAALDLQLKGDNSFSSLAPRLAVLRLQ
jgi:hypothetical protein